MSLGANLASVHSSADDQFLQAIAGCKTGAFSTTWIGGFDAVQVEWSSTKSDLSLGNLKTGFYCRPTLEHFYLCIIYWQQFDCLYSMVMFLWTLRPLLPHRTECGSGVTAPDLTTGTGSRENPIIPVAESHAWWWTTEVISYHNILKWHWALFIVCLKKTCLTRKCKTRLKSVNVCFESVSMQQQYKL